MYFLVDRAQKCTSTKHCDALSLVSLVYLYVNVLVDNLRDESESCFLEFFVSCEDRLIVVFPIERLHNLFALSNDRTDDFSEFLDFFP